MQCFEKRHQSGGLRGTQVLSIRGHIAAALDDLADQLILREPDGDGVERRPAFAAVAVQRMAVVALLDLKHERPLPLQRRASLQILRGNRLLLQASIAGLHGA